MRVELALKIIPHKCVHKFYPICRKVKINKLPTTCKTDKFSLTSDRTKILLLLLIQDLKEDFANDRFVPNYI